MPKPEDALDAYLRRVQAAAAAREADAALSPEQLEAIASELGLTEADLEAAREAGRDHRARGEAFLRHGRHRDALSELSAALALCPGEPKLMLGLAEARLGLFQQSGDAAELLAAQALVRQAIAKDPDLSEAYTLLNRLDPPATPGFPVPARRMSLWAGAAALVLLAGLLAWLTLLSKPADGPNAGPLSPTAARVSSQGSDALVPWAGGAVLPGTRKLPIQLSQGPAGLSLEPRSTKLLVTGEGKAYLTLSTILAWEGEGELDSLSAYLLVRNPEGLLRQRDKLELLPTHQAPRRPGDRIYGNTTLAVAPDAARLELQVHTSEIRPLVGRPALGESFALAWEAEKPPGVVLAIRKRMGSIPPMGSFGLRHAKATFVVENRGLVPLRSLVLELSLLNANEDVVASRKSYAISGEGITLDPGKSALVDYIMEAPPAARSMRLAVVGVE